MSPAAEVVIIGAGIAGVSAGYSLSVGHGVPGVVIVDPRPPLSLTSDKSTECYRNWWPSRPMIGLMNRSIDLLDQMAAESGNVFALNRRGYLFATGDAERFHRMVEDCHLASTLGAGPVRLHPGAIPYRQSPTEGFHGAPEGADILVGREEVRARFPFLADRVTGAIHVRRAGWLSAQQLGAWMLDQAREAGLDLIVDEATGIDVVDGMVRGVRLAGGGSIQAPTVVDAAGPMAAKVAALAGVDLPLFSELHLKVAYREHLEIIPRDAPMLIWSDPQQVDWSKEETRALAEEGREDLLGEMPANCHGRPEGGIDSPYLLGLWEYHGRVQEPTWPLPADPLYPEVVMRGLETMVPRLAAYRHGLPASTVDGGYYTKTAENRPLIGPAGPEGFQLAVGYSGFGVMAAPGGADLLACHIAGSPLPDYAGAFLIDRYQDQEYLLSVDTGTASGQL